MLMYKNGISISNVKDFLGLSDISTTSRYAYADNEDGTTSRKRTHKIDKF